ncbi:T9SS type A sorting domain-containing protein [Limibacter armeniacum]|uniref:T9SS type A sorting domain-containing protein n=1 Tax=Limibacter armeniacum TaxID=466084 RepID=UPI002FE57946
MKLITTILLVLFTLPPIFAQPPEVKVTFKLIKTDTDTEAGELKDGDIVDKNEFPGDDFSVKTEVEGAEVGSVRFIYDGKTYSTEDLVPYSLFGDGKGNYNGKELTLGEHTLTVIIFSEADGKGEILGEVTITFTVEYVIKEQPPLEITFNLVDDNTKQVYELTDGITIDLNDFSEKADTPLYLEAIAPNGTESMELAIDGKARPENDEPYAFWGDSKGNFLTNTLAPGTYVLSGKAFTKDKLAGNQLAEHTITIHIIDTSPAPVTVTGNLVYTPDNMVVTKLMENNQEVKTILLDDFAENAFNVEVKADEPSKSVLIQLAYKATADGDPIELTVIQNNIPFSLYGAVDGKLIGKALPLGFYSIKITAYAEQDAGGEVLATTGGEFEVKRTKGFTRLFLFDVKTDNPVVEIPETKGFTIDLSQYETEHYYFKQVIEEPASNAAAGFTATPYEYVISAITYYDQDGRILPFPIKDGNYKVQGSYTSGEIYTQEWDFNIINAPELPVLESENFLMVRSQFTPFILKGIQIVEGDTLNMTQYTDPNTNLEDEYNLRAEPSQPTDLMQGFYTNLTPNIFEEAPFDFYSGRIDGTIPIGLAAFQLVEDKYVISGFSELEIEGKYYQSLNVGTMLYNTSLRQNIGLLEAPPTGFYYPIDYYSYPAQTIIPTPTYKVGSIKMLINGQTVYTRNAAPYVLTGTDEYGNILPYFPKNTYMELMVETYEGPNATGKLIERYVRSIDALGASQSLSIGTTADLDTDKIQAWPNPSSGKVRISTPKGHGNLEILSVLGQRIKTLPAGHYAIDLPSGIYLLNFNDGNKQRVQKLIVR